MKQLLIKVYGQVQGVCFRLYTLKEAQKLGLTGWVKNEADGTVLIKAKGSQEKLQKLLDWTLKGSPSSSVRKIDHTYSSKLENFNNFEIRH